MNQDSKSTTDFFQNARGFLFGCFGTVTTADALVERGLAQPGRMLHPQR